MPILALVLMIVFLFRDVQVLASRDRANVGRFAGYAVLAAAVALTVACCDARPGVFDPWTQRRFALVAVLVQLAELAAGFFLRRFALGRYSWIGCVLPAPAFLAVLFGSSFALRDHLIGVDTTGAVEVVTAVWLALVGALVTVLRWIDNPWEDREFAGDFALMTSCTALIFVPFSLF